MSKPPRDVGGRARFYGVLPRYMAGGCWTPRHMRSVGSPGDDSQKRRVMRAEKLSRQRSGEEPYT